MRAIASTLLRLVGAVATAPAAGYPMRRGGSCRRTLPTFATAAAVWGIASAADASEAACPPPPQLPSAAQIEAAQRGARDRGFLWRITKDGRSSYLFGTLHLGKLDWAFPGPRLRDVLAAVDTLAVEVDLTDPAVARMMSGAAASPASAPALPEATRQRLRRQFAAACIPEQALAALHPMLQAITLSVLAGRWEGLDAGYAQEITLGMQARSRALPIVALESASAQLELLLPRHPEELERLLGQTLDQLEQGRVRPVLRRLAAVWEGSRLAELERYEQWCDCADTPEDRAFLERLNDARNPPMAERIDALHRGGKRLLVAVGALHMTGPQALPRLLEARGYRVERLLPTQP
jgi:uncharacterized protein